MTTTSPSKAQRITGWVLTVLIALMLMGPSAMGKLLDIEGMPAMFEKMGTDAPMMKKIGILEVAIAILLLIPRTSFIGAILVTGYLGGATWTHVRVHENFLMPVILGVVMWIGLGLRYPTIFKLALGSRSSPPKA